MKMILPVVGMFLLGCAVVAAITGGGREIKQPLPPWLDNLAAVKLLEIRDGDGRVVLVGNFTVTTKQDGDIEGAATLAASGVDPDATGEAEIEIANKKNSVVEKELGVEVRNLMANTSYGLFVDGRQAAVFTTDPRGKAELEMTNEPSS